jgi:hypothetical protein
MKKVLAIALMLLIPCTAFAMETMTVDEMAEITGQSGVAIAMDDIKVFFYTQNEETWYQSAGNFTAASNDLYVYQGALGLIRSDFGQMLYVNGVFAANALTGANGAFTSIGNAATEPNMKRDLMLNYDGNTAGAAYQALNADYGFSFGNKTTPLGVDTAFDSRALTIRAVDRAEALSLGATYRLNALTALGANYNDYAAYTIGDTVAIAAVVIGLPTAEIHYKRGRGETLEVLLSIADNPLSRLGFDPDDQALSDTWSYGKIYYGSNDTGDTLNERTILILDGFIEISPMEAYANPRFY